jgi:hypothetical protein
LFSGANFQPFALEDKKVIDAVFQRHPQALGIYTFAALAIWQKVYNITWSMPHADLLLIQTAEKGIKSLLQPIGAFSEQDENALLADIKSSKYSLKLLGVTDQFLLRHAKFCSHFTVHADRDMANYLYRTEDLAGLHGGHFEKKRNLIAQARHEYRWQTADICMKCHPHCLRILADIATHEKSEKQLQELQKELMALEYTLENFVDLGLSGIAVYVDDTPVAFSIYEALNPNTAVVHFEKAERAYKGLFQVVNQETAKVIKEKGFKYINREEDLGIPGLRHAKTSYFPAAILSNYTLTFKS